MKLSEVVAKYSSSVEFLSALRQEVYQLGKENPDFIYNPGKIGLCQYNGPSTSYDVYKKEYVPVGPACSGCIFGQALKKMGWSDESEMKGSITTVLSSVGISENYVFSKSEDGVFPFVVSIFQNVQSSQDNGDSWGDAIKIIEPFLTQEIVFKV